MAFSVLTLSEAVDHLYTVCLWTEKIYHTILNEACQNEQYFKFSSAFSHAPPPKKNDQEKVCLAKPCLFRVYFSQCTSSLSMYGLSRGWHSHLISLACFWKTSSLNILGCLPESDDGWNRTTEGGTRSLLEDVCHLTAGRCCFLPMFTPNTWV